MKILLTGGAGYIGSHTLKILLENTTYDICVIDNLYSSKESTIKTLQNIRNFTFYNTDLGDKRVISTIFKKEHFDAVIHFAAFIEVAESVSNPLKYYINNTVNTINLVDICINNAVKYFIFSSTAATYGELKDGIASENSEQKPINPYGMSKLMSEKVIRDACSTSLMKYGILRYFNVAGASSDGLIGQDYPNATHLIKVICQCICQKRSQVSIFGDDYETKDGTCLRDYIHVQDLASAHLAVLDYLKFNGSDIFNVGYGRGFSVKEVIECAQKVSKIHFKTKTVLRRMGDPAILISNANKILQKTSWRPKHNNLEEIISTALNWEKNI